jgi:hypothetical protein
VCVKVRQSIIVENVRVCMSSCCAELKRVHCTTALLTFEHSSSFFPNSVSSYLLRALAIEEKTRGCDNPAGTHLNICAILSQLNRHVPALRHAKCAIELLKFEEKENGCGAGAGGGGDGGGEGGDGGDGGGDAADGGRGDGADGGGVRGGESKRGGVAGGGGASNGTNLMVVGLYNMVRRERQIHPAVLYVVGENKQDKT